MSEQWLSIVDYARNYQVSDMTVRRRIKTGKLRAVLQDGKYFIALPAAASASAPAALAAPTPVPPPAAFSPRPQQHRPHTHEISAVKNHPYPTAPQGFQPHQPPRQEARTQPSYTTPPAAAEVSEGLIPTELKRPLQSSNAISVDSRALLAYCEGSLRKVAEGERRTIEKFKGKLEALEAVLAQRDLELKIVRQQLEDAQLLVKILERKA